MLYKDEKELIDLFGKKSHFTVPDGYFEHVNDRVMKSIKTVDKPEQVWTVTVKGHKVGVWARYRKAVIGIAASICAGLFTIGAYLHTSEDSYTHSADNQQNNVAQSSYSNVDAMMDYSMIDTEDMYAYMADAN